jgi:hypothetical protein
MRSFALAVATAVAVLTAAPVFGGSAPAVAGTPSVRADMPTEFSSRHRHHWRHGWYRGHHRGWHRGHHRGWYAYRPHCRTFVSWRYGHPVRVRRCW